MKFLALAILIALFFGILFLFGYDLAKSEEQAKKKKETSNG